MRMQATRALWARDYGQLLYWTGDPTLLAPHVKNGLGFSPNDTPLARSYKLRALVEMELLPEAREALASLTSESLRDLPQDRDYLAVLSQFSMAVAELESREHADVLYELLAPYPMLYATSISFECVGSVSHFLGQLARVRGQLPTALQHIEQAITYNERAELRACVVRSQYELGRLLAGEGALRDITRARALLAEARETALALGLAPLLRRIDACG